MESHKMWKLLQPTVPERPADIMVHRWHHRSQDLGGFPGLFLLFTHTNGCCREQGAWEGAGLAAGPFSVCRRGWHALAFSAVCYWRKAICRNTPPVCSSRKRRADYKKSTFLLRGLRPENLYSEQHFDTYFTLI